MKRMILRFTSLCVVLITLTVTVQAQKPNISVYRFRDSSIASAWAPFDSTLVGYTLIRNGYYQAFLANVGSNYKPINERCISCNNPDLPGKTVSGPSFDPLGRYMLFIAEMANHPGSASGSIPGVGAYCDLYLSTMDGKKAYKLTNMPDTGTSGIIFQSFSPDGKQIMWAQMTKPADIFNGKLTFGAWVIKIALLVDDKVNGPHLANIRTINPGNTDSFNEPYGWSPDMSKIIFASDFDQFWVWDDQIYSVDTLGNTTPKQLTTTGGSVGYPYCEHAFSSPDGKYTVWMTNRESTTGSSKGGDDWWVMGQDGSNQRRLTYFNDTLSSYWDGSTHMNGFGCFSPGSKKFIGDVGGPQPVQTDPNATAKSSLYIIVFNDVTTDVQTRPGLNASECFIYPNPVHDHLNVSLKNNTKKIQYSVSDLAGRKIILGEFSGETSNLDISDYSPGVYFLTLKGAETTITKKFVVEK